MVCGVFTPWGVAHFYVGGLAYTRGDNCRGAVITLTRCAEEVTPAGQPPHDAKGAPPRPPDRVTSVGFLTRVGQD
eukprot:14342990-Heterocapsa_arctica.AAC.1